MTVDKIMMSDPVTVRMDDSVRHVKKLFDEHGFHHLMVTEHHKLVGVISDRDLLRNLSPFIGRPSEHKRDLAMLDRRVHQIMTRKPVFVMADARIDDAAAIVLEDNVSCLPVVNAASHPIGLVTWKDLLRALLEPPDESEADDTPT